MLKFNRICIVVVVPVGKIIFILVAASFLLAQMGEVVGDKGKKKAQKLEYLRDMDINFYDTVVVPMQKKLNELHQNQTKQMVTTKEAIKIEENEKRHASIQINNLRTQIRKRVFADLIALKQHYHPLLLDGSNRMPMKFLMTTQKGCI
jgi:hypothetical protein